MTSDTSLIYALLYPKKMAISHQKYPIFRIFALESADHRSSNTYNETKRKNTHLDKPLLCTQKKFGSLQPSQKILIHENVPDPPPESGSLPTQRLKSRIRDPLG